MFEEARLDVLFWTEFEGDHLVEISVFEPDDYDDPNSGGSTTRSAYVTPAHARTLAAGLQKAADMADAEIARRAKHPPKRNPLPREPRAETTKATDAKDEAAPTTHAPAPTRRDDAKAKRSDRRAIAATIAELGGAEAKPGRRKKPRS